MNKEEEVDFGEVHPFKISFVVHEVKLSMEFLTNLTLLLFCRDDEIFVQTVRDGLVSRQEMIQRTVCALLRESNSCLVVTELQWNSQTLRVKLSRG